MWAVLLHCMRMSPACAQLRGCARCNTLDCVLIYYSAVEQCLDKAALGGHGALGAARLSVKGWLGLDGGLERGRLRRKVQIGLGDEALCGVAGTGLDV